MIIYRLLTVITRSNMTVGMNNCVDRFKAVNSYASKNNFGGAFPTFNEAVYGQGKVYGTWLLKKDAATFRDVLASELGNPQSPMDRFRAVNSYASKNNFEGAFPTFHEANYGQGKVFGVWLLKKGAAVFRDIPAKELGYPMDVEERFRAVNLYAYNNGFGGAFPTFHEADYGRGKVYGAWLIKKDYAVFRDILFYDLLKMLIRPGDIIYGWQSWPGHVGMIIKENADLLVREAYPDNGVSNISLKDFCEGGGYHKTAQYGKSGQNYTRIEVHRVSCDDRKSESAAEKAKNISGTYDYTYLTRSIEMIAGGILSIGCSIPETIEGWRNDWNKDDIWYCSKLVYKAYKRVGFDLYPKTKTCFNPFIAFLKGEYPYLKGDCPWWVIAPTDIITSKYVFPVWSWTQ